MLDALHTRVFAAVDARPPAPQLYKIRAAFAARVDKLEDFATELEAKVATHLRGFEEKLATLAPKPVSELAAELSEHFLNAGSLGAFNQQIETKLAEWRHSLLAEVSSMFHAHLETLRAEHPAAAAVLTEMVHTAAAVAPEAPATEPPSAPIEHEPLATSQFKSPASMLDYIDAVEASMAEGASDEQKATLASWVKQQKAVAYDWELASKAQNPETPAETPVTESASGATPPAV